MHNLENRKFEDELEFKTTKSSGAGGQHVNKTDTRVMLRFDVENSQKLRAFEKQRIRQSLKNQINSDGVLILESQETRSQHKNKELVTAKFYTLLKQALKRRKKRIRTKPSKAAKQKRLDKKKKRGEIKQKRRRDNLY